MQAPSYSAADFLSALQALMPRGRVWPKDPDAAQTQVLTGLAPTFQRNSDASIRLLADAFPSATFGLLHEWEESLGLPDPCAGESPTIQGRRAQVLARFAGTGGQSAQYYINFARNLGYTVTVINYTPFRMSQQRMGSPLGGPDWAYTWAVNAPLNTFTSFRMGQSGMGEPLEIWGNTVLQCELTAMQPAHTNLLFTHYAYLDDPVTAILDNMSLA